LSGESNFSEFYKLLQSSGVVPELGKNQYLTVWAVGNENYDHDPFEGISDILLGGYHANYLAFGMNDLRPGLRIQCLNNIYITIGSKDDGDYVNDAKILSSKKFKNGVVYEISELMRPRTNIFEFIQMLGDEYSVIRDSILCNNTRLFDKANSIPIGVDQTGNTVYDSIFYISNPLFDKANINSEFNQFTLFLPDNNVIDECLSTLKSQYALMGKTFLMKDTLLAINWIKDAIFHNGVVSDYGSVLDLSSAFGKTWRTSVQSVDTENIEEMSNGRIYYVKKLKVPNNVIITRIKSLVHYYEYLSDTDKDALYLWNGTGVSISKGDETPIKTYYWLFSLSGDAATTDPVWVDFPPLDYNSDTEVVSVMKVPPGEYNLYMGFRSKNHPYVNIYFGSGDSPIPENAAPIAIDINASSSSPWNYDRVTETDPKVSKWDGLGGLVGKVVVEGDNMTSFRIKVEVSKPATAGGARTLYVYHWALKPTSNNY
jgi:hypothetical protein